MTLSSREMPDHLADGAAVGRWLRPVTWACGWTAGVRLIVEESCRLS
jgi:hypothetical protein